MSWAWENVLDIPETNGAVLDHFELCIIDFQMSFVDN